MELKPLLRSVTLLFLVLGLAHSPANAGSTKALVALDFRSFSFHPETSLGYLAGLSFKESPIWAVRGTAYVLNRYGENGFQGALGGSYWLTDTWNIDLDADFGTNGAILPIFSIGFGTSVTVSDVATPSFSFQFARYSDADAYILTPAFTWSVVPQLEITAKLNGVLSSFITGRSAGAVSGAAKASFSPFDYFSIFGGLSVGEEPFDPGSPNTPLASYFSQKISGGINFRLEGHLGAEIGLAHEWRNNEKTVFGGEFSVFYTW